MIERCLQADMFAERLRRSARGMSRDELLVVVDDLSRLYENQRAALTWAVGEAARNLAS